MWLEAIPITDMSAATVAITFVEHWVARFGVPETSMTDRAANFEGELPAR